MKNALHSMLDSLLNRQSGIAEPMLKSEAAAVEAPAADDSAEAINANADAVAEFQKSVSELDEQLGKAKKAKGSKAPATLFGDSEDDDEGDEPAKKSDDNDEDDEGGDADVSSENEGSEDDESEDAKEIAAKAKMKKGKMKKSVADTIREDEAAAAALDVEPFLKSLVSAIDERITAEIAELRKSIDGMNSTLVKSAQVQVATGNLIKSMQSAPVVTPAADDVEERKSLLKSVRPSERMFKSNGDTSIPYDEARHHLNELSKSCKLTPSQVAVVEGRLNSGGELPEYFTKLLANVQ
jgi:hypothetical protein